MQLLLVSKRQDTSGQVVSRPCDFIAEQLRALGGTVELVDASNLANSITSASSVRFSHDAIILVGVDAEDEAVHRFCADLGLPASPRCFVWNCAGVACILIGRSVRGGSKAAKQLWLLLNASSMNLPSLRPCYSFQPTMYPVDYQLESSEPCVG